MRFSQLTGRARKRRPCRFPGRYGWIAVKRDVQLSSGWLRRPARSEFRTYRRTGWRACLFGFAAGATVPAALRRARGVRPRWPRRTCRARRRAPSRPQRVGKRAAIVAERRQRHVDGAHTAKDGLGSGSGATSARRSPCRRARRSLSRAPWAVSYAARRGCARSRPSAGTGARHP